MTYNNGISRRQFVKVGSGAAAAALVAGLAGCSSGSGSAAASGSASASASGSASATSGSAASTRTITDIKGDAVAGTVGNIDTLDSRVYDLGIFDLRDPSGIQSHFGPMLIEVFLCRFKEAVIAFALYIFKNRSGCGHHDHLG